MKNAGGLVFLELLIATAASGAAPAGCIVQKGLYDEWAASAKRAGGQRKVLKLLGGTSPSPDPAREQTIGDEYQAFFQCLSAAADEKWEPGAAAFCEPAANDRLALLVCQTVQYVKDGRIGSKDFIEAVPAGKKGAEMIWDLEAIYSSRPKAPAAVFQPKGPAYKIVDELFVLVLDDQAAAVAKYFNIAGASTDAGARHIDAQIKLLMMESPAVVIRQWEVIRQYLPKIKNVLSEMSRSLPPADLKKMRQGIAVLCTKDNLDCPEIVKTFGRPE